RAPARAALSVSAQQVVLRRTLRLPVRASRLVARAAAVEGRRRLADRRVRSGRCVGARDRRHQPRGAIADRLPLSLRLRHADRRRGAYHLVHVRLRSSLMSSVPLLSLVTFLPLLGALLIVAVRGDDAAATRNARWIA